MLAIARMRETTKPKINNGNRKTRRERPQLPKLRLTKSMVVKISQITETYNKKMQEAEAAVAVEEVVEEIIMVKKDPATEVQEENTEAEEVEDIEVEKVDIEEPVPEELGIEVADIKARTKPTPA